MTKVFTDVEVFLRAVGQEVPATPQKDWTEQSELYKELIKEEVKEFWDADAIGSDVEEVDACFDMIWVIVGYMKSRGWDCGGIWDEGAKSNLSKIDPITGFVKRREDGKILKPDGWQKPDFSKFVFKE
jgi:predicted HAD superfamily Cof-like phosphohydrolase